MTEGAPRGRAGYLHPRGDLWCDPRRPLSSDPRLGTVRQAARLGSAISPAPSPRPAHDRAAPRGTTGFAAPPARVSSAMPGLSTGCRLQAPDFRAARHFSSTNSLPQHPTEITTSSLRGALLFHNNTTLRSARAYIPPRALPLPSSSSRGKLPEGGRFPR